MIKNDFPFGSTVDRYMDGSIELDDWPVVFDWGVCKNEMKWYDNEKVQYVENYEFADFIMQKFDEWNKTMRGHTVYWSVDDMNPTWFQEGLYAGDKWEEMNERLWNRIEMVYSSSVHSNLFINYSAWRVYVTISPLPVRFFY